MAYFVVTGTGDWPKVQVSATVSIAGWTNGGGGSSRSRRFFPAYQFTDPHGTLFAGESDVSSRANRLRVR